MSAAFSFCIYMYEATLSVTLGSKHIILIFSFIPYMPACLKLYCITSCLRIAELLSVSTAKKEEKRGKK